jgi:hypothetical protein
MVMAVVLGLGTAAAAPAQGDNWANKLFTFQGGTQGLYHDFGTVPNGSMLRHSFPIYNPWAIPIEITELRVSCGCVSAKVSKNLLQPRESAVLEATMDTSKFKTPGHRTVSIFVSVGPQYISTATVQVSATRRDDVVFNPGQVSFGVVAAGQSPTRSIEMEYAGALDWRVNEVIKNNAPVEIVQEEMYRRPGQPGRGQAAAFQEVGYRLRVTLKPDAPPGQLTAKLLLKTNDPASPLVPVLVEATIQAPLTVVPSALSFGNAKIGDTVSKRVIVRGTEPFKITGIEGLGDAFTVELPGKSDVQQILTIKYQAKASGEMHQQLKIRTDLPQEAAVTLKVEGTVAP